MGEIIGSKVGKGGKIVYEVVVDYDEALQLKGHMKNIHVFSEDVSLISSNLSVRGKNDATKYFLVPKELRGGLRLSGSVKCAKIDLPSKTVFTFIVDKLGF